MNTSRRRDWSIVLALVVVLAVAAFLGRLNSPDPAVTDPRQSTLLTGPRGARAMADALELMGVRIERRLRPLWEIDTDTAWRGAGSLVALLDVGLAPTGSETAALERFVREGGRLFISGQSALTNCLGYRVRSMQFLRPSTVSLERPTPGLDLPEVQVVLEPLTQKERRDRLIALGCNALTPVRVDTLLAATDGRAVALELTLSRGGRVTLLADPALIANRALKDTDAGLVTLPWLLSGGTRRITFDEYHHGFAKGGSIWQAAGQWLISQPGGWAMLQLVVASLAGLYLLARRLGPPVDLVERHRRSPLEHVEALASGLERAKGVSVAVELLVAGLRRRLAPASRGPQRRDRTDEWLESLTLAANTPEAEKRIGRLRGLARTGGPERVLDTALAVEDVWQAMRS